MLCSFKDWEEYAASHVSLGPQLESITQLILDWRARELRSENDMPFSILK